MYLGGRKHCPILQEQLKDDHRLYDRVGRRDTALSICRARDSAQQWGQLGIDTKQKEKCPRKEAGFL